MAFDARRNAPLPRHRRAQRRQVHQHRNPRGIRNDDARHAQRQRDRIRRNAGIGERVQNVRGDARLAEIAQKIFRKHPRHIGQPRIGVGAECGAHVMEAIGLAVS